MVSIKHVFVTTKADDPDATFVRPSNWNADHAITTTAGFVYIARGAAGSGPAGEFPIDHATVDDLTMMTKAQVTAAITAALANVDIPAVGDLCASFASSKSHWIIADGRTIGNAGSTATFASTTAQALFTLLWGINSATWPVQSSTGTPSRGLSAAADWTALKKIPLPDARGRSLTMRDIGAGVNGLVTLLGVAVGSAKKSLDITNIPSHIHTITTTGRLGQSSGTGGVGGGSSLWDFGGGGVPPTDPTGGDPAATPAFSSPVAFDVTSPTFGVNIFMKL